MDKREIHDPQDLVTRQKDLIKGLEIQAPPIYSGSSDIQRPKLKTLVIPFVLKQLYPAMTLKEF